MASLAARLRSYDAELKRLVAASERIEARDMARIRAIYAAFSREAKLAIPHEAALTQHSIQLVLQRLAEQIDAMTRQLDGIIRGGMSAKQELASEMERLYVRTWRPDEYGVSRYVGTSPEIMTAAADYSARLVGWSHGGLASRITGEIDGALRRAALDLSSRGTETARISHALGLGDGWTYQAERIYRTEVNRFYSLVTERQIQRLAKTHEVYKRWHWSGISRKEHAEIHGQLVPAAGAFEVPRRGGGSVLMPYPRAAADPDGNAIPGDCTINCGCFHCAVPAEAVADSIETRTPVVSLNPAA